MKNSTPESRTYQCANVVEGSRKGNLFHFFQRLVFNIVFYILVLTLTDELHEISLTQLPIPSSSIGATKSCDTGATGSNEESEYSFKAGSKAPRMFQFKKKSITGTTEVSEGSKRVSCGIIPGFQSTLKLVESKNGK